MPTQVKLVQMVDLALGTPEVGAVNFNVLHTLLHAMLRKLNIVEVQAEISEFDRDFLSSSKSRQISALSDLDSGKGDDSEDALSEKSSSAGPGPRKSTPYHRLEVKVEKIAEQLEQFNNDLPKYKELFEKSSDTPVADIWKYIQMQGDVETNKKGLAEVWKLVQEMMVNMKKLEDENKKLLEKINGLNMDDLNRRLKELEDKTNDLNEKFKQLPAFPTEEEWAQFVTWPGLEDALTGVKKDWENIQPPERVVIEMSSQTEPISRPTSSRPSTRMSSSPGPSVELLDILEKLGNLTASHEALTKRVEDLEEEMKNKLDKSALENFDLSSDLLQQLGKLKEDLDALALAREKDSDALSRAQQAILQLQAEVERLHTITKEILEDNQERAKQLQGVFQYCDKLQDTKADKEYVQMEVDVKADKRSLDNKVNHSLFDATTNDINRMIKEILDKLAGNEETWNSTIKKFADDIDGKLDRLELDPLKEWLESRLKALNDKLRKQQAQVEWTEDDAAGIRKQLIQRFHCISCDRPVDLVPTGVVLDPVPALPSRDALPPTRSPRPYTTFELDQIRQHAKSFASTEVSDYYATTRPCGGSHTMTYPHKRITRLSHLSHLFREEDGTVYPIYKEEVDVQGADGHIYKGRMAGKLEAKLPIVPQDRSKSPIPMSQRRTTVSPPPGHKAVHHHRPSSARLTPRRANGQSDSRPQSAHPGGSRQGTPGPDQSPQPVPAPPESPNLPDVPPVDQAPIEVPISSES